LNFGRWPPPGAKIARTHARNMPSPTLRKIDASILCVEMKKGVLSAENHKATLQLNHVFEESDCFFAGKKGKHFELLKVTPKSPSGP
jgi:hypothetical protein